MATSGLYGLQLTYAITPTKRYYTHKTRDRYWGFWHNARDSIFRTSVGLSFVVVEVQTF